MQTLPSFVSALSHDAWEGALLPQLRTQSSTVLALLDHHNHLHPTSLPEISLHDGGDDDINGDQSSASIQALMVPELLKSILLELRLADLLTKIPRVCKHWQATIEGSIKIQRALFFKPLSDVRLEQGGKVAFLLRTNTMWNHPVIANPFILQLSNDYLVSVNHASHMPKGVERPEASWRRMQVTQPPMAIVDMHSLWCGCNTLDLECRSPHYNSDFKSGTKLGQVITKELTPMHISYWDAVGAEIAGEMALGLDAALHRKLLNVDNTDLGGWHSRTSSAKMS